MKGREHLDRWITASVLAFAGFVPLSIVGEQIALGFLILGLIVRSLLDRAQTSLESRSIFDGPLLLHAATLAISVLLTTVPEVTGGERLNLWRLLSLVALSAALDRDRELTRRAVRVFLFVLLGVSLYAIVQHYTGIDLTRPASRAVAIPADFRPDRFRPTGTFNWYSTLAFVLATGLAFAFALALETREGLRRRVVYGLLSLPAVLALAFTQVRATWIGLAGGFLLGALLRGRRTLLWVSVVGAVLAGGILGLSPGVRAKAEATFDLAYRNNSERVFMWARALEMVADRPGTGIGHGAYTPATAWYYDRWDAEFPVRCHAHNNFLHFWATAGPLGLLAYLWIFVAFFRFLVPAYREARARRDGLAAGLGLGALVAVIGFLLASLFQDPYFDGEVFYGAVFALAVGGAVVRWSAPARGPLRPMLAAGGAILGGTAVGLIQGPAGLDLDPLAPAPGVAGSLLVGTGVFLLGVILVLAGEARGEARQRGEADTFLWSLGLTALTTLAAPWLVLVVMVPRLGLQATVSPWVGLTSLPPLFLAAGVYLLLRRPGRVGRLALLLPVGVLATVLWYRPGFPPTAAAEPAPGEATLAGAVAWGEADACRGAVVSPLGLLTTGACAARLRGEARWGGHPFACQRVARDLPGELALLRCRSSDPGVDLRDLELPGSRFPEALVPGLSGAGWARILATLDADEDRRPDPVDGCARFDPSQTDTDRDGVTDACEPVRLLTPLGDGRFLGAGGKGEVFHLRLEDAGAAPTLRLDSAAGLRIGDQPLTGLAAVDFEGNSEPSVMAVAELPGDLYRLVPGEKEQTAGAFWPRAGWVGLASTRLPSWASGGTPGRHLVGARRRQPSLVVHGLDDAGMLSTLAASPLEEGAADPLAMAAGDLGGDGYDELLLLQGGASPRLTVFRIERGHRVLRVAGEVTLPGLGLAGPPGARVTLLPARGRVWIYDREGALHPVAVRPEGTALHLEAREVLAQGPPAHWVVERGPSLFVYRVTDPALERLPLSRPGPRGAR